MIIRLRTDDNRAKESEVVRRTVATGVTQIGQALITKVGLSEWVFAEEPFAEVDLQISIHQAALRNAVEFGSMILVSRQSKHMCRLVAECERFEAGRARL